MCSAVRMWHHFSLIWLAEACMQTSLSHSPHTPFIIPANLDKTCQKITKTVASKTLTLEREASVP